MIRLFFSFIEHDIRDKVTFPHFEVRSVCTAALIPANLSTTLKFGEICFVLFVFESGIVRFLVQDADVVNLQLKRSVISIHHGETNGINLFLINRHLLVLNGTFVSHEETREWNLDILPIWTPSGEEVKVIGVVPMNVPPTRRVQGYHVRSSIPSDSGDKVTEIPPVVSGVSFKRPS